jgi:cell division protein FtsB
MDKILANRRKVIVLVLVVIAVFLILDYHSRSALLFKVESQHKLIQEEVNQLEQTQQSLLADIEYATSYAYVQQYAREEKREVQEGDIAIVPLSPYEITPVPTPVILPTPQAVKNWDVWYAIFFEN